jgi:hypothetical protein
MYRGNRGKSVWLVDFPVFISWKVCCHCCSFASHVVLYYVLICYFVLPHPLELQWSIVGLLYWCGGTSVCSFCFSLLVLTIVLAVLNNRESQQFCPAASVRVALVDCWAVYWCCGTFVFIFGIFKVCAHCFFLGSVLHIVLIIFIAFSEQQDLSVFYSRHGQNGLHHRHGWQNLDAGRSSQGRYRLILVLFCGAVRNRIRFMLTDCPTFSATQFGYLSELLRWHASDEPSLDKFTRNDEACSQWQGNRNLCRLPATLATLLSQWRG